MRFLDWTVVILYAVSMLAIGAWFFRRAGRTTESFFIAGRTLPWWVVGIAISATHTGAASAPVFTMLVYRNGLVGNWWWWLSFAVWMPLVAVLWAKFWRRLRVTTSAEFMERRFGGRRARLFRGFYAVYISLGWSILLNAYALRWLSKATAPIFHWPEAWLFLFALGVLLVYGTVAGLYGVVYTDIPQLGIFLAANLIIVPVVLHRVGGLDHVYREVVARQGSAFLQPLPPAGEIAGMTFVFLLVQGLFFASSPAGAEAYAAQKFMAARNESHAQAGQMLNAVLTLVVRVVPFLFLGLIGAAVLPAVGTNPENVWGILISRYSVPGLTGLLVAAELAAFMSTVSTHMNCQSAFLVNDIYRPFVRRAASERHYVLVGRLASIGFILVSAVVGYFFVTRMMAWFLFLNSVAIAFVLPTSWLRFFWWRHNLYGEGAAILLGLPLSYLVWFPLGFSDPARHPYWQGFLILFGLGWLVIVGLDLLTPAESPATLGEFYRTCRPPGLWGPVERGIPAAERASIARANLKDLADGVLGVVFCLGLVASLTTLLGRRWELFFPIFAATAASGVWILVRWKRHGILAALRSAGPDPAASGEAVKNRWS
jgi:SSS family solute:Na+ symporter